MNNYYYTMQEKANIFKISKQDLKIICKGLFIPKKWYCVYRRIVRDSSMMNLLKMSNIFVVYIRTEFCHVDFTWALWIHLTQSVISALCVWSLIFIWHSRHLHSQKDPLIQVILSSSLIRLISQVHIIHAQVFSDCIIKISNRNW